MARNVPVTLDDHEVAVAIGRLAPGWSGSAQSLSRSIEFAGFLTAVEFIALLAPRCEELDHHPDLDLRWRRVDIGLTTHACGGVTSLDVALAGIIDDVAQSLAKPQAD
ncbi:MAG: 4a-hydroxytetrahydrobiopterin dehydratase [Actinomycetota bacterium]|nr:4a-hydroxytetrahydrobiopterin dehydratase [Actinomycetota bacterium]